MKILFKITKPLLEMIRSDLVRSHNFAYERVGFLSCRVGKNGMGDWVLLAAEYHQVDDQDYLKDETVGATIGPDAIRKMMQKAYDDPVSIVHLHEHCHLGTPRLSSVDYTEMAKLIPNFWNVRPQLPHAALVLSYDSICGFAWEPASGKRIPIEDFSIVGSPLMFIRNKDE